jgi:hypothetical protein
LRRLWRLFGWFVVVEASITVFGITTAPLLLFLALDVVIGLLIIRSCMERRAGFSVALATAARSGIPEGGR